MNILQKFGKSLDDDGLDILKDSIESCHYSFLIKNTSTPEDYINKRVELHVHLAIWLDGQSVVSDYLCLTYQMPTDNVDLHGFELDIDAFVIAEDDSFFVKTGSKQEAMLIDYFEFVKIPQGVRAKFIPSLIRLQLLD